MLQNIFHNLLSHAHGRIQSRKCVLENNSRFLSTILAHFFFRQLQNILSPVNDLASFFDLAGIFDQSHDRLGSHGLSAAGFPHDRDRLSFVKIKRHTANRLNLAGICMIRYSEIFHL